MKYYFFKIHLERNQQGQNRKVVYPIPGQVSPSMVPIRTDWKVQLELHENTKACRLPVGTIIGIQREENGVVSCFLSEHRRGEIYFYRAADEIFQMSNFETRVPNLHVGNEEMRRALEELIGIPGELAHVEPSQNAEPAPSRAAEQEQSFDIIVPSMQHELARIEERLRTDHTPGRALAKTLIIAKIRDRMNNGVARFSYFKQNGEHREAYGTRSPFIIGLLGGQGLGQDAQTLSDGRHFRYFDIQRMAWRNFCVDDIDELLPDGFIDINNMDAIRAIRDRAVEV